MSKQHRRIVVDVPLDVARLVEEQRRAVPLDASPRRLGAVVVDLLRRGLAMPGDAPAAPGARVVA